MKKIFKVHGKYAGDYYQYKHGKTLLPVNKLKDCLKSTEAKSGEYVIINHWGYKPERFQDFVVIKN